MADRRFTLEEALAMLHRDANHRRAGLANEARRLAQHLREAYAAQVLDVDETAKTADYLHVFDVRAPVPIPAGARLELHALGYQIGTSIIAPVIEPGRYRAVLQLVRLEDEPKRS